jgi:hypothetical protein
MTPTPQTTAALLLHRERIESALRTAATRNPTPARRKLFPRMNRGPLLRLA